MVQNTSNMIASGMDAILRDPEYKSIFSSSTILEKLAFTRVADEDKPTEIEVELAAELDKQSLSENPQLESVASDTARADCIACGKKRAGWTETMGVCKCASQSGCSPLDGCKENCACNCKAKKAGEIMDTLIKSAFDSLMSASDDLEEAGFEDLSANALMLMNDLIVEAKAKKKMTKEERAAAKEKADVAKAKEREKAEKLKLKEKADKEKAKERAEKDKNSARDKALKEKSKSDKDKQKAKLDAEKVKADKAKKNK